MILSVYPTMTFASEKGGHVAARLYSLVMSCKLAEVNVEEYLEDVLTAVATTPSSRLDELTPWCQGSRSAGFPESR